MACNKTVSVIVPIYNVEKYLKKCINSILNQTYPYLQVILVDDGSTDSSGIICDSYDSIDSRICVIHKANGGVSSARNAGLNKITGHYVSFVDADDFLEPRIYEMLVDAIEKNDAEVSFCGYQHLYEEKVVAVDPYKTETLSSEEAIEAVCAGQYSLTLWNKLFNVSAIMCQSKEEIYMELFEDDLSIGEDMYWLIKVLLRCKTIACSPYIGYNYRMSRPGSAVYDGKKTNWYRACSSRRDASLRTFVLLENSKKKASYLYFKRYLFSVKDIMCYSYLDKRLDLIKATENELRAGLKRYKKMPISFNEYFFVIKCNVLITMAKLRIPNGIFKRIMAM